MSADVPFIVKYLELEEHKVRVYAVTREEAKNRVEHMPRVAQVVSVEEEQ